MLPEPSLLSDWRQCL